MGKSTHFLGQPLPQGAEVDEAAADHRLHDRQPVWRNRSAASNMSVSRTFPILRYSMWECLSCNSTALTAFPTSSFSPPTAPSSHVDYVVWTSIGNSKRYSTITNKTSAHRNRPFCISATDYKLSLDKGRCQYQSGTALISDSSDGIRRNESFFSVVPPEMLLNP